MFGTRKRLAAGVGALILVLVSLFVVGTALADDPPATATPSSADSADKANYRQVFLDKLATTLGIDRAKLDSSLKQAAKDTVDEAVANGDLARNPADRMKEEIDNGRLGFLGGFEKLRGRLPKSPPPGQVQKAVIDVAVTSQQAIAGKLGITPIELRQQVRSGKTLAELAQAKGLTEQILFDAAADAVKAKLDPLVASGRIAQARADEVVKSVREGKLIGLKVAAKDVKREVKSVAKS